MRHLQIASKVTAVALIATLMVPLSLVAKESDAVFGIKDRVAIQKMLPVPVNGLFQDAY